VVSQEPTACPVGCNFKVENLFFNVPARRKFLKTNATELNNILSAFERIVLVYPEINFVLYSNGQELMNLKAGSLRQRISDVFGKKSCQDLLPVEVDTAICRITGFVGKPESARKKGVHNYFFVNGRFMRHPYFHKAISNAFERLVPEGTQVPYFIYFDVAPADIDVNIHPTKTEIKFENEQSIWQILQAAVKDAIGKFCEVPSIDFDTEGRPDIPVFDPQRDAVELPRVKYNSDYNPFADGGQSAKSKVLPDWQQLYKAAAGPSYTEDFLFAPVQEPENETLISEKSPVHYQYKGRYIMTAVKSGLMIIDQQRADIRIRFERFMEQFRQKTATTQRILFPVVFDFPLSDSVLVDRYIPDLQKMGFDMSSLGGGSYVVNGIPSGLEGLDPERLIRQVVADALEKGGGNTDNIHETLALSMARHAAIPLGQVLSNEEMEQVVDELFACSNVNYTPDGRKILHILPQQDIEQLLGG
jgi:DNA mismatch repair protein MutL